MTLPNFLVIGAMKAGTTSMHRYLDAHPAVFMATQKELNFFIEELNWSKGLGWYEERFAEAGDATARGEASPGYAGYPVRRGVPERIAATLPDARFVYLVREPVDRMRSQWVHRTLRGIERRPMREALLTDPRYLSKSQYALQAQRYLDCFPRERLLVVVAEELRASRSSVMREVFEFLGVDPAWSGDVLREEFHRTESKARREPMRGPPELVQRLPGYGVVVRQAPVAVKRMYRAASRSLTRAARPADPRSVEMPGTLRAELEDQLRDDLGRFKRLMPPSFDAWGML